LQKLRLHPRGVAAILVLAPLHAMAEPGPKCLAHAGLDHLVCSTPPVPVEAPYGVSPLSLEDRNRIAGVSWRGGCPIALSELSNVVVPYVDPSGTPKVGRIIVATQYAHGIEHVFRELFQRAFPIARMDPVDAFDGDDGRSMEGNNTSGFNCRPGPHAGEWSRHAWGDAIDLNPLWNPQVIGSVVSPAGGNAWLDRKNLRPGMVVRDGAVVALFRAQKWHWGGRWPKTKDYQHFSATGR
jgi:poly-gamma-glutamate synthesis protein (capsule biosynthesis protein)